MLEINVLDVRHGDSIIIKTPDSKWCIIDCNMVDDDIPVINYIIANNIKEIEFICLTHHHSDHYNGLYELLDYCLSNNIIIHKYYDCGLSHKLLEVFYDEEKYLKKIYGKISEYCSINRRFLNVCRNDKSIFEISGFSIVGLAPYEDTFREIVAKKYKEKEKELNDATNILSIVLLIRYESHNIILLGDSDKDTQNKIFEDNQELHKAVSLIKISHHGSINNFNEDFINKIYTRKNSCAVISAGCIKKMPSIDVMNKLKEKRIKVYSTNSWDIGRILDDKPIPELSEDLNTCLFAVSDPYDEYEKAIPYHGTISISLDDTGMRIETETGKEPL